MLDVRTDAAQLQSCVVTRTLAVVAAIAARPRQQIEFLATSLMKGDTFSSDKFIKP